MTSDLKVYWKTEECNHPPKWISCWNIRFVEDDLVVAHCSKFDKTIEGKDLQSIFDEITEFILPGSTDSTLDKRRLKWKIVDEWRMRHDEEGSHSPFIAHNPPQMTEMWEQEKYHVEQVVDLITKRADDLLEQYWSGEIGFDELQKLINQKPTFEVLGDSVKISWPKG